MNLTYEGCEDFLAKIDLQGILSVTEVKPKVASSGEKVSLKGEGFIKEAVAVIAGKEVSLDVQSSSEASFIVPEGVKDGEVEALVKKEDLSRELELYIQNDTEYPLLQVKHQKFVLEKNSMIKMVI